MKRYWGHLIAVVGIAVSAAGLNAACAHDDSTIFIRYVLQPPVASGNGCLYSSDPSQPYISSGTLDIAFTTSYYAEFLVGNQMTPRGSVESNRTETSRVILQGAIVRVTDAATGAELRPAFTVSAGGSVDPASGGTPQYTPFGVVIFDSQAAAAVSIPQGGRTRALTYVKVFGHTLGGQRVESNEFQFPIDICRGCLVTFPQGVSSPLLPQPNCANTGASTGGSTSTGLPCIFGQDQLIDCRLCPPGHTDVCGLTALSLDAGGG